ncbi:MAG: FMN-binding protein [Chloroflexi bacterium]|nr:FMN-binding protein [Chloroflexota bacterium]
MRKYLQLAVVFIIFFSAVFFRHVTEAEPRPFQRASSPDGGAPRAMPTPTVPPAQTPTPAPALPAAATVPPTATATPTETPLPSPTATVPTIITEATTSAVKTWPTLFVDSVFNDGAFTGKPARTTYGNLQVQVVMHDGKIEDILTPEYPVRTPTSEKMSREIIPQLRAQALALQDWDVDVVSGATQTSQAFKKAMVYSLRESEQHQPST